MTTTTEEKAVLPDSVTLGGVTYSVKDTPELQAFMASVAKVEKSKLYTQFNSLQQSLNQLKEVKVIPASAPLAEDARQELIKGVAAEIMPQLTNLVQPLIDAQNNSKQLALAAYRERLIQENVATCIPEMVTGNSEEELKASLAESIRIRSSLPSPNTQHNASPVKDPLIVAQQQRYQEEHNLPVEIPGYPALDLQHGASSPKTMTIEQFSAQRDALLQELQSTYGG